MWSSPTRWATTTRRSTTSHRPRPESFGRLSINTIATELGVSDKTAKRVMTRYAWMGLTPSTVNGRTTYDARAFEQLKAMKSFPHRTGHDWLAHYLGEPHV